MKQQTIFRVALPKGGKNLELTIKGESLPYENLQGNERWNKGVKKPASSSTKSRKDKNEGQ